MDWMIRKIRGIGWCPHGKDSGSPPQPASPKEQGQAQTGVNTQTAALQTMLNRYNSNSPTGSTTWQSRIDPLEQQRYDRDLQTYNAQQSGYLNALKNNGGSTYGLTAPNAPAAPIASQWTQNTTLTPGQQQLFDLKQSNQAQLYGQASQALAKPVDLSHLPSQVSNLGLNNDFSAERQKAEDALYNRSTSRLDPQYAQTQSDLETKLYNQGIAPGTDAWNRELSNLGRQKTDAYSQARNDAIGNAGQEQSRLFGMADTLASQNAGLANQQRQQGLQELFSLRQSPLQEINLLEGRSNNLPNPIAPPGTQVGQTDLGGAYNNAYQSQLAGYNSDVATNNANTGAGAAIASAAITAAVI